MRILDQTVGGLETIALHEPHPDAGTGAIAAVDTVELDLATLPVAEDFLERDEDLVGKIVEILTRGLELLYGDIQSDCARDGRSQQPPVGPPLPELPRHCVAPSARPGRRQPEGPGASPVIG